MVIDVFEITFEHLITSHCKEYMRILLLLFIQAFCCGLYFACLRFLSLDLHTVPKNLAIAIALTFSQ